jgi:hypothetical protein
MTTGRKWALGITLGGVVLIGGELLYLHHERSAAWQPANQAVDTASDPDDLVFLKKERPEDLADVKQLDGTTLWVSAGGQMDYYPYAAHHADYSKTAGTLLGAEPLAIVDAFEQVAPKSAATRIARGDKQVLLAFTMPKSADPAKQYAVPVGYKQGKDYTFYTDEIFFYVDPHQLYNYWDPRIWQAIDSHQVIQGMNERQVQLSLGQISKSGSDDFGNRTVEFYNLGKPMAVTFVKNRATGFQPDPGY